MDNRKNYHHNASIPIDSVLFYRNCKLLFILFAVKIRNGIHFESKVFCNIVSQIMFGEQMDGSMDGRTNEWTVDWTHVSKHVLPPVYIFQQRKKRKEN